MGKYSTDEGAKSEATCESCVPGKYLETEGKFGEDHCDQCEAGIINERLKDNNIPKSIQAIAKGL